MWTTHRANDEWGMKGAAWTRGISRKFRKQDWSDPTSALGSSKFRKASTHSIPTDIKGHEDSPRVALFTISLDCTACTYPRAV